MSNEGINIVTCTRQSKHIKAIPLLWNDVITLWQLFMENPSTRYTGMPVSLIYNCTLKAEKCHLFNVNVSLGESRLSAALMRKRSTLTIPPSLSYAVTTTTQTYHKSFNYIWLLLYLELYTRQAWVDDKLKMFTECLQMSTFSNLVNIFGITIRNAFK